MRAINKKVTLTILSISLLTVMAGAAVAPALGIIKQHFCNESELLIQLIVSTPALFIIITSLFFSYICSFAKTKSIALLGLIMYVVCGSGVFFIDNIHILLILRALLGVSVGLIMPLSTGLIALYYPEDQQAKLMGLAAAMSQMGGVIATLLAGLLANIAWNYAFLVYLLGLIAMVLVALYLPNEDLSVKSKELRSKGDSRSEIIKKHSSLIISMLLIMIIFFIFPTNFAIIAGKTTSLSNSAITWIMVGLDLIAAYVGFRFGSMMKKFSRSSKYFGGATFLIGYIFYSITTLYGSNAYAVTTLVVGSIFIGFANGFAIPYLNTIASIREGKNSATTIMPLLSASLFLGQFISPLVVLPMSSLLFGSEDVTAPFKVGIIFSLIFILQVYLSRESQKGM